MFGGGTGRLNLTHGQQTLKCLPPGFSAGRPRRSRWAAWVGLSHQTPRPSTPYTQADGEACQRYGVDVLWMCPETGQAVRTHQPCKSLDCATCYPSVKKRRGLRVAESFGGVAQGFAVFTIPYELRRVVGPKQALDLRAKLAQLVIAWVERHWGARAGCVIAFHPAGDRCTACGHKEPRDSQRANVQGGCPECGAPPTWLPHYDVLIPLLGIRGGAPYRLPYPVPHDALADLKSRWADMLLGIVAVSGVTLRDRTADMLCGADGMRRSVVDYRYAPSGANKRILHRYRYSLRPFPAWSAAARAEGWAPLLTPGRYGLCGPGAAKGDVEHIRHRWLPGMRPEECPCVVCRWREMVAADLERAEPLRCTCCAEPRDLVVVDVAKVHTERWRGWGWIPLHETQAKGPAPPLPTKEPAGRRSCRGISPTRGDDPGH